MIRVIEATAAHSLPQPTSWRMSKSSEYRAGVWLLEASAGETNEKLTFMTLEPYLSLLLLHPQLIRETV
jgi:hypothetical protein